MIELLNLTLMGLSLAAWVGVAVWLRRQSWERVWDWLTATDPVCFSVPAVLLLWVATYAASAMLAEAIMGVPAPKSAEALVSYALVLLIQLAACLAIVTQWPGFRPRDLGMAPDNWRVDLVVGAAGYLAALVPVSLLAQPFLEEMKDRPHALIELLRSDSSASTRMLACLTAAVIVPLYEEFMFRVLLQGSLGAVLPRWAAILVASAAFCAVHSYPDAIPLFPLALVLGIVYSVRKSYLAAVATHGLFNSVTLTFQLLFPDAV